MNTTPSSSPPATRHPSGLALEAFALGEASANVSEHLSSCEACASYVARTRATLEVASPSKEAAKDLVAKLDSRAGSAETSAPAREKARRVWWRTASTLVVPLAAAAALVFLLRSPSTKDSFPTTPGTVMATASTTAPATSEPVRNPETSFKGGIQIAVIRDRNGDQARFTGPVPVRPGDRLRVEVALDRDQAILAAVMGDDGSWVELMPAQVRQPGTHFSERSARVDSTPMRGTIVVGSPEAVSRVRESKHVQMAVDDRREGDGLLKAVRVEWEAGSP